MALSCLFFISKSLEVLGMVTVTGDLELHHSLVHELDDLVFISELW